MRKTLHPIIVASLAVIFFSSCNTNNGDDWTLKKRISIGDISILVPETYESTISNANQIDVENGFKGSSVSLEKKAVAGRTQESVFTDEISIYPHPSPITSDTILLEHPTKKIESVYNITAQIGGSHTIKTFIFIEDDWVYKVEFYWSEEYYQLSLNLMYEMLNSLEIK